MAEESKPQKSEESPEAMPTLHVAPGPHLQDTRLTTRKMMLDVIIALVPVMVAAGIVFRQYALKQAAVCVGACMLAEFLFATMRGRRATLGDLSAVVTGLILALSLPWNTPIYVAVIGSFVAIGIGKAVFGGVGYNLFNPAMVGRAFVMLAFAGAVGAPAYVTNLGDLPWLESLGAMPQQYGIGVDATSGATPMTGAHALQAGEGGFVTHLLPLLLGNTIGSLGETSALACILGGLYLCVRRTASWEIPAGILLAVLAVAGVENLLNPNDPWTLLHQVLGGALLFGAFFIATDPVTSPLTPKGKFIFGLGVGIFIMVIRLLSAYPEGVMFAVLLMNSVTPLINRWTVPKPFGGPAPAPVKT